MPRRPSPTATDPIDSPVVIRQNPNNPLPTEIVADAIVQLAAGMRELRSGRLNDRALHLLICEACPSYGNNRRIGMREVKAVLAGIEALERTFLRSEE
jgi:hypothetical protein